MIKIISKFLLGDDYAPLAAQSLELIPHRPTISHRDRLRLQDTATPETVMPAIVAIPLPAQYSVSE